MNWVPVRDCEFGEGKCLCIRAPSNKLHLSGLLLPLQGHLCTQVRLIQILHESELFASWESLPRDSSQLLVQSDNSSEGDCFNAMFFAKARLKHKNVIHTTLSSHLLPYHPDQGRAHNLNEKFKLCAQFFNLCKVFAEFASNLS